MNSMGRRHRPFFRICAFDSHRPRDGRPIEELGHYDPMVRNAEAQTVLDVSRIRYWLSVGAQPSQKVHALLRRFGVKKPAPGEPWQVAETPVTVTPSPSTAVTGAPGPGSPVTGTPNPETPQPTAS